MLFRGTRQGRHIIRDTVLEQRHHRLLLYGDCLLRVVGRGFRTLICLFREYIHWILVRTIRDREIIFIPTLSIILFRSLASSYPHIEQYRTHQAWMKMCLVQSEALVVVADWMFTANGSRSCCSGAIVIL